MSHLTDLIRQARTENPELGAALEREITKLTQRRTFGLVFEAHQPEAVELPQRTVRRGDKVRILPPRGTTTKGDQTLWHVDRIERTLDGRQAHITVVGGDDTRQVPCEDLVVVSEFRDHMYPGLVETGRVERGGPSKPFHTVINAENFHALEMLTYTHRHAVDCIYIDPPYNTGAKDWMYNNDYVEADDDYRHSKWLSFMERRLQVARELLNPEDSVLIVTIDEKEYLRLGMLLEQTFPEGRVQMISSVINPKGSSRANGYGRTDEYIFFVMLGASSPKRLPLSAEWKISSDARSSTLRWADLSRSGENGRRVRSPNLFYPIFVRADSEGNPTFAGVGEPCFEDEPTADVPEGAYAVWPVRRSGEHGTWQTSHTNLPGLIKQGFVRLGRWREGQTNITFLTRGEREKVLSGEYTVVGYSPDGSVRVDSDGYTPRFVPGTQWRISSHNAEQGGTNTLKAMLPGRRFPYPKSLYAVEDALRFFVKEKPDAVVLDFFSGSGTTAHAVMRLNKQDGGRRQCISVTNNEVSAEEQKALRKKGLRPGDPEWEQWGICDYITKPRITAAITGGTPAGDPIKGDYKFTDEFPMADGFEENAAFFTLTYEDPRFVGMHRAFARIAPMLWMRAGAEGRIIDDLGESGWDVSEVYAVAHEPEDPTAFLEAVSAAEGVRTVFIVTDSNGVFEATAQQLPDHVTPVRLYESYLHNFTINRGA